MYTIDLFKGEGVPLRSRPGGIAFACLVVVVPFLAAAGMASFYMDNNVVIAIQRQQVSRLTTAVATLSDAVQKRESLERQKTEATRMLSEVKTALDGHHQWSPILASLIESLSDTLVLTRLEARQDTIRAKIPAKDDPALAAASGVSQAQGRGRKPRQHERPRRDRAGAQLQLRDRFQRPSQFAEGRLVPHRQDPRRLWPEGHAVRNTTGAND